MGMKSISVLMCVYNDNVFTKVCLEAISEIADQIVVVEGSWDGPRGTYDYGENLRSDDGTREIIEKFQQGHPDCVLADSIGDEECSRNLGLNLCKHDWVLHLDSDEFYWPDHIQYVKRHLNSIEEEGYTLIEFGENTFYFNFHYHMVGNRVRMFNTGSGVHYISANGVGDILQGPSLQKTSMPGISMFHFQWIGDRSKVLCTNNIEKERAYQRSKGEDPDKVVLLGGWQWWLNEIYLKFNGKNLRELEEKARGSIHPWSFRFPEHRNNPLLTTLADQFPPLVRQAPWFNFREEGLVKLAPDT
jgi:glycosyltransferase involved in cell wall biosynthesis